MQKGASGGRFNMSRPKTYLEALEYASKGIPGEHSKRTILCLLLVRWANPCAPGKTSQADMQRKSQDTRTGILTMAASCYIPLLDAGPASYEVAKAQKMK